MTLLKIYIYFTEHTHYRHDETPHLLDLVFTNKQDMMNDIQYLPGLGCSDHVCLSFKLKCYSSQRSCKPRPNCVMRISTGCLNYLAIFDWHQNLTPLSTIEAWEYFTMFNDILHQCIPLTNQCKKKNIYMSSDALHLKNRKNKLWTKYCRSKSNYDFNRYCEARNNLRTLTRSLRSDYEKNLSLNVKQNPKTFWKYINSRLKVRPTIDDLQCPDGSTAHTDI